MEDELEPNDARDDAYRLSPGQTVAGHTCSGNPDWFALIGDAPQPGQIVRAFIEFRHQDGDVDARLFRGEQSVASGTSVSDDELLESTVPDGEPLPYTVEIYGHNGAQAPYEVTVTIEDP